jgi:hypothetical protein
MKHLTSSLPEASPIFHHSNARRAQQEQKPMLYLKKPILEDRLAKHSPAPPTPKPKLPALNPSNPAPRSSSSPPKSWIIEMKTKKKASPPPPGAEPVQKVSPQA